MPHHADDKRYVSWVGISDTSWEWLVNQANDAGLRLSEYIGLLVDDAMESWRPPAPDEPERRILWNLQKLESVERMRSRVYRAAAIYEKDPTEENALILESMCSDAGMDYAEILEEMRSDPFSSLQAFSRNGSTLGECMRWLPKFLQERNGCVPSRVVQAVAQRQEFSESTLRRARKAINFDRDTPSIVSRRVQTGWVWMIVEETTQ